MRAPCPVCPCGLLCENQPVRPLQHERTVKFFDAGGPTTRSTAAAATRSTARHATTVFTGAAPRTIVRARTRVGVDATRALRRSSPSPANASPWTERAWPRGPTRPSPDAPPLRTRARRTLPEMPATIRRQSRRRSRGAASTQNARARAAAGAGASPDAPGVCKEFYYDCYR